MKKETKNYLISGFKFFPLLVFLVVLSTPLHEYGHLLTANALGCNARIVGFNYIVVGCPDETRYTLVAFMGGVFASFMLSVFVVFAFGTWYAKYFLFFAWMQFVFGISEGIIGHTTYTEPFNDIFVLVGLLALYVSTDLKIAIKELET